MLIRSEFAATSVSEKSPLSKSSIIETIVVARASWATRGTSAETRAQSDDRNAAKIEGCRDAFRAGEARPVGLATNWSGTVVLLDFREEGLPSPIRWSRVDPRGVLPSGASRPGSSGSEAHERLRAQPAAHCQAQALGKMDQQQLAELLAPSSLWSPTRWRARNQLPVEPLRDRGAFSTAGPLEVRKLPTPSALDRGGLCSTNRKGERGQHAPASSSPNCWSSRTSRAVRTPRPRSSWTEQRFPKILPTHPQASAHFRGCRDSRYLAPLASAGIRARWCAGWCNGASHEEGVERARRLSLPLGLLVETQRCGHVRVPELIAHRLGVGASRD